MVDKIKIFIKELLQRIAILLGFKDSNNDGKIDTNEFISQLSILIIQAGYSIHPITDDDIQKILNFFKIENIEMLKQLHLAEIIRGLIELGIIKK